VHLSSQAHPRTYFVEPEEVAAVALMLAKESAGGITGQAIDVDGGEPIYQE